MTGLLLLLLLLSVYCRIVLHFVCYLLVVWLLFVFVDESITMWHDDKKEVSKLEHCNTVTLLGGIGKLIYNCKRVMSKKCLL